MGVSNSNDIGFVNNGKVYGILVLYNERYEEVFDKIIKAEISGAITDIELSRILSNNIPEGIFKRYFQNRINQISTSEELEKKL